jgi:hypothetical protein
MMDTAQMQQILRNYGHSDARAAIEGKQPHEWERALSTAGFQDAATVVTKFVPRQATLNDMPTTGRTAGPQPPAGKAPLQSLDDWEALPDREQLARMDEVDWLIQQDGAA